MGVAPRSTGRGNGGLHSLVPVMKSNNQNGITLSITGNQDPSNHPAYYAFDGIFPNTANVSRPQDYTSIYTQPTGRMSIYISFPSKKKIYSVLQVPISVSNAGPGSIYLYGKENDNTYTQLGASDTGTAIALMESQVVKAYKEYRIDCYRGGTTIGCGIAQLQIFGK